MNSEFNPYASPLANEKSLDEPTLCPQLPLVLRPSIPEIVFVTLFGCILALASVFAARASISLLTFPPAFPLAVASTLIAIASFVGSIIFLSSTRAKIIADTNRLQILGSKRISILYQEIENWHVHPANRAIQVMIVGHTKHLAVPSWPISENDSESLSAVLRQFVGPPGSKG